MGGEVFAVRDRKVVVGAALGALAGQFEETQYCCSFERTDRATLASWALATELASRRAMPCSLCSHSLYSSACSRENSRAKSRRCWRKPGSLSAPSETRCRCGRKASSAASETRHLFPQKAPLLNWGGAPEAGDARHVGAGARTREPREPVLAHGASRRARASGWWCCARRRPSSTARAARGGERGV